MDATFVELLRSAVRDTIRARMLDPRDERLIRSGGASSAEELEFVESVADALERRLRSRGPVARAGLRLVN